MKQSRKIEFFGLLIFLSVALVFLGTSLLDAQVKITGKGGKKPKPEEPQYTWQVTIPGEDLAISSGYNLFGYFGQDNIYEDKGEGDGIGIVVEKIGRRGAVESQFRLGVFNNIDEFGQCVSWEDGPKKIGFQNIVPDDWRLADTAAEEYPCFFPPAYPPYPCNDPDHGKGDAPYCMAAFLNNNLQPYCDPLCGHPECSYDYVEISIKVDCDFDNITQSDTIDTTGIVWIEVVNTYDLQTGCEYPHNISGDCIIEDIEDPDANIFIGRTDVNTWTITVDGTFTFAEIYKGMFRGKGKRWEYKIPYWAQIPLSFETTWTRHEVTQ